MIKYIFLIILFILMKKYLIFIFMLVSSFSSYAEGNSLSCIPNSTVCENCPESKILFPLQELDDGQEGLDIEADNSEVSETDSYNFTGNVKLKTNSHFLSADQIDYSQASELTTATGNVKYQDESFIMTSDQLTAQIVDNELIAKTTNANYQDISSGVLSPNGFAQEITKDKSKINLKNTSYTLCPLGQQDWMIKAKQIKLNQETNRGVADNATLYFYGMPIFYLPKYGWVLSGRGSGFLSPSFNSYSESNAVNKDGKFTSYGRSNRFRVPYYFNLAPDRDLILALTYMSSRGIIYEGKYRQLVKSKVSDEREHSILSVESKYLVEDNITGVRRWLLYSSLDQDLTEKLTLNIAYHRISDKNYFKDIDRSAPKDLSLKSNITLSTSNTMRSMSTFTDDILSLSNTVQ